MDLDHNMLRDLWKKKNGKAIVIGIYAAFFLAIAFIVGNFVYIGSAGAEYFTDMKLWKCLYYGLGTVPGLIASAIIFAIATVISIVLLFMSSDLDRVSFEDERGVRYDKKGEYGTAHPMTDKEAKKVFEIGDIEEVRGPILGQFSSDGKRTICLPEWTERNRNIVILGSPGTGKSFGYVRNAVFQAVRREESIVVTDPKGEIYMDMAGFLREHGYEVRVFDLVDLQASDAWDCMGEIYDPKTGDLNQLRLNEFTDTIFRNTTEGKDDPFWGTGEKNLFNAAIAYCAYMREVALKYNYERAVTYMLTRDPSNNISEEYRKQLLDRIEVKSYSTMNDRRKIVMFLLGYYYGKDSIREKMRQVEEDTFIPLENRTRQPAPACDISEVYYLIINNDLKTLADKFNSANIPMSHVASIAWHIFINGGDNVKPGFVTGLAQRLYLFQMRDLRRITSKQDTDEIVMERLGERKCAYFCVLSDKNAAMRPIASLFFSFMFRDVADAADRYGPQNRIPVNVILDEFSNVGMIPNFAGTISTVRSRKINISIILQSVSQLAQVYGDKSLANTIIACCDTVLFLGCNDEETAKHMSDLSGIASIRVGSTKDSRANTMGWRPMGQGYDVTDGAGKRNVYNMDEIRSLGRDEVLIYHNGCNMLRARRCGFIEHPFYKSGMPPQEFLSERVPASERFQLSEKLDKFMVGDLTKAMDSAKEEQMNNLKAGTKNAYNTTKNAPKNLSKKNGPIQLTDN